MDRAEQKGLVAALAAHVLLFAALSLGLLSAKIPRPPIADTMDVTLTDKVGMMSAAPKVATEAPAPSQAPEQGPPEDSAPPPPAPEPAPAPKPTPAPPKPTPAPPKPEPKPEPKPTPKPQPKPKPAPEKPEPKPKPAPEKPAAKPVPDKKKPGLPSDFLSDLPKDTAGKGKANAKPKGSRIGADFLKGLTADKNAGKSDAPRASAVSAQSMVGLVGLIAAQVKPCYNPPAGGADAGQIVTVLSIRMNRDGSVASVTAGAQTGVNGSNGAYARQMSDAARRAILRCAPLHLPPDLYSGGWDDFDFRFKPDLMQ
jgi:outer membrane biosynthesis protein TonB